MNFCKIVQQREDDQHYFLHCLGLKRSPFGSVGRFPQISRRAALGPLIPLSLSLNLSSTCWTYPIQTKSWGRWGVLAHVFTRPTWSAYYIQRCLYEHEQNVREKNKGHFLDISEHYQTLSLSISLVHFPEFSLAIALFPVVIQIFKNLVCVAPCIQRSQNTWKTCNKIWLAFPHD